jgi:alpha-methylacyl-CoA racemase
MTTGDQGLPLHGLRVLDMSRFQPGAYLTRMLAELGAEVIKIEPPGRGAPERMIDFTTASLHHSKRSLALDVRSPDALPVLDKLVAGADVVVESAAPGSLDAKGVGYAHFSEVNPRIIWCGVTGFGADGPYSQTAGHDISYLAQAGMLSRLAEPEELPDQPSVLLAGPIAALMGTIGILAAVARRERTGEGCFVDDGIADSVMWLMGAARGQQPWHLRHPARATYRCADGKRISIASAEPNTWRALAAGLGLDLGEVPGGPPDQADETRAALANAFATQPAAHWVATLGAAAVTPCNDPVDLPDDPHVRARNGIVDVERNGIVDKIVRLPLRFSGVDADANLPRPAPSVGADTEDLLREAGLDEEVIAGLLAAGVIGAAS